MAILNLTIDTENYSCTATVDGKAVADVDRVEVYNFGTRERPEYTFSLRTYAKEDGVSYMTTVMASARVPDGQIREASAIGRGLSQFRVDSRGTAADLMARAFAAGRKSGGDS